MFEIRSKQPKAKENGYISISLKATISMTAVSTIVGINVFWRLESHIF